MAGYANRRRTSMRGGTYSSKRVWIGSERRNPYPFDARTSLRASLNGIYPLNCRDTKWLGYAAIATREAAVKSRRARERPSTWVE